MKGYNEYKNVDLAWYPHGIPSHWALRRHKNVLTEHKELVGDNSADYTLLSLTLNGVIIRDISEGKGKFAKEYDKYVVVDKGDLIFCLFDVEETPRTVGLSKHNGMITGAYDVFKPHDINPEFFYYYYLALDNVKALKPLYSGLRKVIPYPSFMAMKFPVPPTDEQEQIVRYLDWKVSKINQLIQGYQKQIKLLAETKRTIIDSAVFRGIRDSDLMFSGNELLGNIPSHWKIVKLRTLLKSVSVKNHPTEQLLSVVRERGIIVRDVESKESNHNYIPDDLSGYKLVEKGNFVINKMKAWQGSYGVSDYRGIVSPAYYVFDLNYDYPPFFHLAIRSKRYVQFFNQASDGIRVGQWDLSMSRMKEIPFVVPPISEQKEIVTYIETKLAEFDNTKTSLEKEIALLREYRTRLISDVVTGQVDVRGVEIPDYTPTDDTNPDEINDIEEVTDIVD